MYSHTVRAMVLLWHFDRYGRIDKHMTCSAGFECLTEDLEEVMGLFNELIQEPALPQDKLLLYKNQVSLKFSVNARALELMRASSAGLPASKQALLLSS